jgi:hypothetical protein
MFALERSVPRDISPGAGLRQHHLCQQSRLRSPGAYLKSIYCAVHRDSVNNFVVLYNGMWHADWGIGFLLLKLKRPAQRTKFSFCKQNKSRTVLIFLVSLGQIRSRPQ